MICSDGTPYSIYDEREVTANEQLGSWKQLGRPQQGELVGTLSGAGLEKTAPVPVTPVYWVSPAGRRVVTSTFAAETSTAIEALGHGLYARALMCKVVLGIGSCPTNGARATCRPVLSQPARICAAAFRRNLVPATTATQVYMWLR